MQKSKSAEERAANKQLNTDLISLVVFSKISISMVVVVVFLWSGDNTPHLLFKRA